MSLKNEFVTSVASYQLHTIWEESSFQINIICLEDDRAWKGKVGLLLLTGLRNIDHCFLYLLAF